MHIANVYHRPYYDIIAACFDITIHAGPDTEACLILPTTQTVCLTVVLDTLSVQVALAAVSKSVFSAN